MNIPNQINIIDDHISSDDLLKVISNSLLTMVDSFFILDVRILLHQHFNFERLMPRVKPFYAIKCNPNETILAILAAMGVNFDCASKREIQTILNLGVSPDRIIYANPTKLISHIKFAQEKYVNLMTFDHENELYKIKKYHPNAKVLLRIRSDSKVATATFGHKYGCQVSRDVSRILGVAKTLNIAVVGICFHVGSNCQDTDAYYQAISKARKAFNCAKELGFEMNILDIGGGFPYNKSITIEQIAESVNSGLKEFFPDSENVTVIAEPGRYYVSPVLTLGTRICSHKPNLDDNTYAYYIGDGIFGNFMGITFQDMENVTPLIFKNFDDTQLYPSSIWGPTCDGADLVLSNYLLPKLELHDWVFFHNMGAYSLSLRTDFNNFDSPPIIAVADEKVKKHLLSPNVSKDCFEDNGIKHIVHSLNSTVPLQ